MRLIFLIYFLLVITSCKYSYERSFFISQYSYDYTDSLNLKFEDTTANIVINNTSNQNEVYINIENNFIGKLIMTPESVIMFERIENGFQDTLLCFDTAISKKWNYKLSDPFSYDIKVVDIETINSVKFLLFKFSYNTFGHGTGSIAYILANIDFGIVKVVRNHYHGLIFREYFNKVRKDSILDFDTSIDFENRYPISH